jgi:hypothetical protein
LSDVPVTLALADAAGEWFREIVGALHGSVSPTTRERMIREIFLLAEERARKRPMVPPSWSRLFC